MIKYGMVYIFVGFALFNYFYLDDPILTGASILFGITEFCSARRGK